MFWLRGDKIRTITKRACEDIRVNEFGRIVYLRIRGGYIAIALEIVISLLKFWNLFFNYATGLSGVNEFCFIAIE